MVVRSGVRGAEKRVRRAFAGPRAERERAAAAARVGVGDREAADEPPADLDGACDGTTRTRDRLVAMASLTPRHPRLEARPIGPRESACSTQPQTAARSLRERIERSPQTDISRALLASTYGHQGRSEEARAAWTELKRVNPDYSLDRCGAILPYARAADFARIAEGVRKAGIGSPAAAGRR